MEERVKLLAELVKAAINGNEKNVKDLFDDVCTLSDCEARGKDLDMKTISSKALDLIVSLNAGLEEQAPINNHLQSLGSLMGKTVITNQQETEEGNESTPQ